MPPLETCPPQTLMVSLWLITLPLTHTFYFYTLQFLDLQVAAAHHTMLEVGLIGSQLCLPDCSASLERYDRGHAQPKPRSGLVLGVQFVRKLNACWHGQSAASSGGGKRKQRQTVYIGDSQGETNRAFSRRNRVFILREFIEQALPAPAGSTVLDVAGNIPPGNSIAMCCSDIHIATSRWKGFPVMASLQC